MSYDDGYGDQDAGYDEYAEADDYTDQQQALVVGDAETLLRRAIDIIATAPTMPLSSSPRIDRDEIIVCAFCDTYMNPDQAERLAKWLQQSAATTRRRALAKEQSND